ncbi:MAG: type II toxin-antitoxin system HipA family toxin [Endomicrobia bacterium]|nr:type II toxin-antitoxin system HipA family toxin [Endomicrobiia bacterium]
MNKDKILSVRLCGEEAGFLEQDENGRLKFSYSDNANFQISKSLPIEKKVFNEKECRPYFNGLLPESEKTRKRIGQIFGISRNNDFSMLKAIGRDCAGAVSLTSIDEPLEKSTFIKLEGHCQTEESFFEHLKELPEKPFFADETNDIRLSLAGAQNKSCISIIDGKICLPKNHTPTTHIVKPMSENFDDIVLNEYLCMKLAKAVGVAAPEVSIEQAKDISYLLIERYDREIKNGAVKRIHQEDFCQALGILSINKYQAEGGPSIKDCFELLNQTSTPAKNRNIVMKTIMFNFLIGNNDAHAKNFSLLYNDNNIDISPAYDLVSTEVYPKLSKKMAMKIDAFYEKQRISLDSWKSLCEKIGYSLSLLKAEFMEFADLLPKLLTEEIEKINIKENDKSLIAKLSKVIDNNCFIVHNTFK